MIYRRFGYLSARVLLDKQDRLQRLEQRLDEFDNENQGCSVTTQPNARTKSAIDDRNKLLLEVDTAFSDYGTMHSGQNNFVTDM